MIYCSLLFYNDFFLSVGKGSVYGTFSPPPRHISDGDIEKERTLKSGAASGEEGSPKKREIYHPPRNITTNPVKKGGYGYYHTTIGGFEYPHMPEDPLASYPYSSNSSSSSSSSPSNASTRTRTMGGSKSRSTTNSPLHARPFVSTSYGNRLFTGNAIYRDDNIPITKNASVTQRSLSAPNRRKPNGNTSNNNNNSTLAVPFKGMSHALDTFNKFPEWMPCPDNDDDLELSGSKGKGEINNSGNADESERDRRGKRRRNAITHSPTWRPSGTNDFSSPTASVCNFYFFLFYFILFHCISSF